MKVIITGAYGMLGKDILKVLTDDPDFTPYSFDIQKNPAISHKNAIIMDITDFDKANAAIDKIKPDAIIHCAAFTDVKWCEQDKNHAATDRLHVDATKNLASYKGAKFICISTDSVFDGKLGNYSEDALPSPLTYYAKSKLDGERAALKANKETLIIRTNIYGFHSPARISSFFIDGALNSLRASKNINGYDNVFVNFIYTKQLAMIIGKMLKANVNGLINVASKETVSKYGFLLKLADTFNFDKGLINEQAAPPSMNPGNTSLNIDKLKALLDITPTIDEGLKMLKNDIMLTEGK